jgi:hypothetical protein
MYLEFQFFLVIVFIKIVKETLSLRSILTHYKTVKVSCLNNDDFQLFVRIKLDEEVEAKQEA